MRQIVAGGYAGGARGSRVPVLASFPPVELRQASFGFWIKDLSAPEPYFVLPLLNGVTMVIQYKLNPTPTDPIQQRS